MSKRAPRFVRREKDFYPTEARAVKPLIPHLPIGVRYFEPCAGDGRLIRHLRRHGMVCTGAIDIEQRDDFIPVGDALELVDRDLGGAELIVTNPPYERNTMHAMIERFRRLRPTWLLLESDWLMTLQAEPLLTYASDIVAVGRVKKIDGSKSAGYDNHAWVRFQATPTATRFHARARVLKVSYDTEAEHEIARSTHRPHLDQAAA